MNDDYTAGGLLGKMVVVRVLRLLTLMLMVTSTTAFTNQPVSYSITTRIRPSSSSSFTHLYVGGSDEDENNIINKDSLLTLQEEGKNSNDDDNTNETSPSAAASLKSDAQFGEVSRLHGDSDDDPTALFGDVVRFDDGNNRNNNNNRPATSSNETTSAESHDSSSSSSSLTKQVETRKRNNIVVALLSISLAFVNYFWQWTHPISAIQLLATMEQSSAPITVIAGKSSNSDNTATTTTTAGGNGKPTMVEFWAPWCENCKQMAPTLYQIEQEYSDRVNFIMVNGDSPEAWPLIELFGVDAIPHIAMVEADGTVDTALIGPVPKAWLEKDLQVLVENSKQLLLLDDDPSSSSSFTERAKLPYKMLDTFSNRPEERKIQSDMLSSKQ